MGKTLHLPTRSLGSDVPVPSLGELAEWISARRGAEGDLLSYRIEQGLRLQVAAGITHPCAGGLFYAERWRDTMSGFREGKITGEPGYDSTLLVRDAGDILAICRDSWLALPAPHLMGFLDSYYNDPFEAQDAVCNLYLDQMRSMRDAGIAGHILISEKADDRELELLAGRKVFFFQKRYTAASLSTLLEYQHSLAIPGKHLPLLYDLMEEYLVSKVILLEPDDGSLRDLLIRREADKISCGGYCTSNCHQFWGDLVNASNVITASRPGPRNGKSGKSSGKG